MNFNMVLEAGGVAISEKVKLEVDVEVVLATDAVENQATA